MSKRISAETKALPHGGAPGVVQSAIAGAGPTGQGATSAGLKRPRQLGDTTLAYLLSLPALIIVVLLVAYPVGSSLWISLHEYNLKRPDTFEFVGLGNYLSAFQSDLFRHSLRITATFTLASVALVLVIGTGIALVVNEAFHGRGVVRAVAQVHFVVPDDGVPRGLAETRHVREQPALDLD